MVRKIEVVPYDPDWARQFAVEAERLWEVLGDEIVAIHHLGSTAIPGIKAKPVIDIWIEVRDIEKVEDYNGAMMQLGYLPKGEYGIPGRRYFCKGSDTLHTHHLHIYQAGNPDVARYVNFRDYLMAYPDEAQAYSRLKEGLARQFREDARGYTEGKTEFIREIDKKARAWRKALV